MFIVEGPGKRGFLDFLVDMLSFKYLFSVMLKRQNSWIIFSGTNFHKIPLRGQMELLEHLEAQTTIQLIKAAMKKILLGANITVPEYEEYNNKLFDLREEMSATDMYRQSLQLC